MATLPFPAPRTGFESNLLRSKVFNIIKAKSFSRGRFKLASGEESDYYLDMKPSTLSGDGLVPLAQLVWEKIRGLKPDYVGGLAVGSIPITTALAMHSYNEGQPFAGFYVRKEIKDHGTMKRIEGLPPGEKLTGKRVVILDDVTTKGDSAMFAVERVREEGADVILVLSILDREEGAESLYKKHGIPFDALFRAREFMD